MTPTPYRFEYLLELACSLCARPVTTVASPRRSTRVLLLRVIDCGVCNGVAVQGEVTRVYVPKPMPARPRRGRPPKRLQEPAA